MDLVTGIWLAAGIIMLLLFLIAIVGEEK